jgi:hypothetical protein
MDDLTTAVEILQFLSGKEPHPPADNAEMNAQKALALRLAEKVYGKIKFAGKRADPEKYQLINEDGMLSYATMEDSNNNVLVSRAFEISHMKIAEWYMGMQIVTQALYILVYQFSRDRVQLFNSAAVDTACGIAAAPAQPTMAAAAPAQPTMVVNPPTMVVDPPTMVVDPPTMVVDPPTMVPAQPAQPTMAPAQPAQPVQPTMVPAQPVRQRTIYDALLTAQPLVESSRMDNPKVILGNWCKVHSVNNPVYKTVQQGSSHAPKFYSTVAIDGIELGESAAARKAAAEVEACKCAVDRILLWTKVLRLRNDKFLQYGSLMSELIDVKIPTFHFISSCPKFEALPTHAKIQLMCVQLIIHVNSFANTSGGKIVFGIEPSNSAIHGALFNRDEVDQLIQMFDQLSQQWTPPLDPKKNKWNIWPVISEEDMQSAQIVNVLEKIYSARDPRGLVWPLGCRVVLMLQVAKADKIITMPRDHITEIPDGCPGNVALVRAAGGGVRFLKPYELESKAL